MPVISIRTIDSGLAGLALIALAACSPAPSSPEAAGYAAAAPDAGTRDAEHTEPPAVDPYGEAAGVISALLGENSHNRTALPAGLVAGGDCLPVTHGAAAQIAALAAATVPVKPGLTLVEAWTPEPGSEYECLLQVTAVGPDGIDMTHSCDRPGDEREYRRRLCLADVAAGNTLMTQTGALEIIGPDGEDLPETMVGTNYLGLSRAQFAELKHSGAVGHRYVQVQAGAGALSMQASAQLKREAMTKATMAINNRVVDVPVMKVSGSATYERGGKISTGQVSALVLDDESMPLLVEYTQSFDGDTGQLFRLSYAKISFPDSNASSLEELTDGGPGAAAPGGSLEQRLAQDNKVDVYGIYFAFNSDRIRKESTPILEEIAQVLRRNPDWKLGIHGHTDDVGGNDYNLELSRRRSAAVRTALIERFGIAPERLGTAGHGAGAPKDRNDTPEGRARNRRVELMRQ